MANDGYPQGAPLKATTNPMIDEHYASRVLKVNHAGEHGAVNIYAGQIFAARFTAKQMVADLLEFQSHEIKHRSTFLAELQRRGRPRCKSYVLCGIGGYVLGLITGLLGPRAIAATTVAVESVVLKHLSGQLQALRGVDDAACCAIESIVLEEREHHDKSASHMQEGGFWQVILRPIVTASTEMVIWLGMRL